ncbi:MAG: hypothetical protein AAF501_17410, partial [Pseudomonadota bacterium]
ADAQSLLESKQADFAVAMQSAYPTLSGETITAETVAILDGAWEAIPSGALSYARTTTRGR